MIDYGFTTDLEADFDTVVGEVTARLKEAGFGVLTTIDVKAKFKEKLDIEFRRYTILGACNPHMAHQAIETEEDIGLMLPCNVIVCEKDGKTHVAAIRPRAAMGMIDNPKLLEIAEKVEASLKKVMDSLARAAVK